MGSNNVAVVGGDWQRVGRVEVGHGPTGVVVDEARDRVYVLNRFDASVSVIDAEAMVEIGRVDFYDPTPEVIRAGRPFLYDTHRTSGLGQASCGSCHVDGRMDQLAWDLGDPGGEMKPFNQSCLDIVDILFECEDWHPMKGPMTTQTLVGMIGTEPFHWRGDREDLPAFNGAFHALLGDDEVLTEQETAEFLAFAATLTTPPNPFREIDGTLPPVLHGGIPAIGQFWFEDVALDVAVFSCADCHAGPAGTNGIMVQGVVLGESQSMKVPQLRNMYEKTGFAFGSANNNRGFGFIHDGSVDSLFNFLNFGGFLFLPGELGEQQRLDVVALLMCFATDTPAAVGLQATVPGPVLLPGQRATWQQLIVLASGSIAGIELVARGIIDGEQRGYAMTSPGVFQSDRAAEVLTTEALIASTVPGGRITFTVVPHGSAIRIGVDRDEDGWYDGDERDAGSDPANPDSTPDTMIPADLNGDGAVDSNDLLLLMSAWGPCSGDCPADLNDDGMVAAMDLLILLSMWS